jgi:hypothetical protein
MADDPATRFQIFLHSADVRLDLRDRKYRPPLIALPKNVPEEKFRETVESYIDSGMIRNQGAEGACTGFAMAAVIDFLLWQATLREEIRNWRRDQAGDGLASHVRIRASLAPHRSRIRRRDGRGRCRELSADQRKRLPTTLATGWFVYKLVTHWKVDLILALNPSHR